MGDERKPDTRHPAREFRTRERCFITELLNDPSLDDVSVARARVEPGVTTERHVLSVMEWYVVEAGHGRMRLGGRPPFDIAPGDTVTIPAHCEQQVSNLGSDDLLFFCVCVPRFEPSCYEPRE